MKSKQMAEKNLESLLPEGVKLEPQSKYSSEIIITFDKNADEMLLQKNFRRYKIRFEKLSNRKYMLSPTDGESNDILRHYVWDYFKDK
jgi:hypothetical protein